MKTFIAVCLFGLVLPFVFSSNTAFASDFSLCPSTGSKNDCFAVFTYTNGDIYIGEFKNNKRHGQGTLTSNDGTQYVGKWGDNKFNGQGMETYPNGDKYIGEFKNNNRHGQGIVTFSNGNESVVGIWNDNELQAVKHQKQNLIKTTKTKEKLNSPSNIEHGFSVLYFLFVLAGLFLLWLGYEWNSQGIKKHKKTNHKKNRNSKSTQKEKNAKDALNSKIFLTDLTFFKIDKNYSFEELKIVRNLKLKENHPDKVAQMSSEIKNVARQQTEKINDAFERLREHLSSRQN